MNIIKCGLRVLMPACSISIFLGCASSIPAKQCCSVDWYLSHDANRAEKLSRCSRINAEAIGQACNNAVMAEKMSSSELGNKKLTRGSREAANL